MLRRVSGKRRRAMRRWGAIYDRISEGRRCMFRFQRSVFAHQWRMEACEFVQVRLRPFTYTSLPTDQVTATLLVHVRFPTMLLISIHHYHEEI